jgi:hypothetical protein
MVASSTIDHAPLVALAGSPHLPPHLAPSHDVATPAPAKLPPTAAVGRPSTSATGVPVPPAGPAAPIRCCRAGWRPGVAQRRRSSPHRPPLLGLARVSGAVGGPRAAERLAAIAGRVTDRDRRLCRLLHDHRVLTTHQLTQLAFTNHNTAQDRLTILHRLGLIDRFRPHHTPGSAPYHYVLGPLGAALLAAHHDPDPIPGLASYRRDRALTLAHSQRLGHLVGVNSFFCALAHTARHHPDAELERWWSEQRCASHWGQLIRPDGYGRWREHHRRVDFFLEYDRASEAPHRLAGKLNGYLQLADASHISTPVLVWLPTPARETTIRHALTGTSFPVATATPHPNHSPAGPLWLPLNASGPRSRLIDLPQAW